MAKKPVRITETVLRDGHQSLTATRMRLDDMKPMLETLDKAGYFAIEAWGGATFDTCLRFLNEDPWARLDYLKAHLKTPISMLLRGQNLLGYNHYADDVVAAFVKKMVEHGIGVIRVFDALNDIRNLEVAIKAGKEAGAHVQGTCVYTISPYHTKESYVELARGLVKMGVNSICIKDMSGLLKPYVAYDLVKALKAEIGDLPLELHTHYTSGFGSMTYLKAIEAGVDIIDCALSPFALGTSQPCTETMIAALEGTDRDTNIDRHALKPAVLHFAQVKKDLAETFKLAKTSFDVNTDVLDFQIPGGMLSNLFNQLKEQGMEDKYQDLLDEMPRVRADLGYPPLVTPSSQIVGSMATFNVMMGERYKIVPREVKDLARGKYGRTPLPVNEEVREKIIGNDPIIDYRPADDIPPQMEKLKTELAEKGYPNASIEDVLSYALFPEVALEFFKNNR
ncbi:pyruvate carboxylase subunit B [Anaerosinus gibii]|uniref:Pyruvate carboxylase subunit B n=1 Tax=Selenobaculum gibii TaxID=3054208 RepID=A0A9Y2AH03_9FIRM|nr:pyruvate carboxylase subunit B [Selenobaculum gbiensis]WIW69697.1 pyruvate carboxylase subunit B [Selenobaculum gbiensis]